jgi:hypothetical protein
VVQCKTWSQIVAITSKIDEQVRLKSWNVLSESEQRRIIMMKKRLNHRKLKLGTRLTG